MGQGYDFAFMEIALEEARKNHGGLDLPIGAALVIDGTLAGTTRNLNNSNETWDNHAEALAIRAHSKYIRKARESGKRVEIFTTFEPCLGCFGACVMNRVNRIVYACPDPRGGATHLTPEMAGIGYAEIWPERAYLQQFMDESRSLLLDYMERRGEKWQDMILALRQARTSPPLHQTI